MNNRKEISEAEKARINIVIWEAFYKGANKVPDASTSIQIDHYAYMSQINAIPK